MSVETTPTNPALQAVQSEWLKAKAAEKEWHKYKLAMEEQVITQLTQLGYDLPEKGRLKLEHLSITFGETRTWSQPSLGHLLVERPELLGTAIKIEYKPISNPVIDELVKTNGTISVDIQGCFKDKPKKAAFTAN